MDNPQIDSCGNKVWIVNGLLHREDGPAFEWANGNKDWYVNGEYLSGPLNLLGYSANWKDLVEWMTPREIALCRT